ncbi:MAG: WGR domain-containing protein [Deltaproteobacteria bacterium]|nr:WGR domain-containing protein [Deltaproteobacteria bacterium]
MNSTDRFYGMKIPEPALQLTDEGLTLQDETDLVSAHLKANYGYFGAIDKTLSGFYILSDEDDNYLLFDAREPDGKGQVWFQDHEERYFYPHFASLEEYEEYCREKSILEKKDEEDEEGDFDLYDELEKLKEQYQTVTKKSSLVVSTSKLADRYQWLVWSLQQPTEYTPEEKIGFTSSLSHFSSEKSIHTTFKKELKGIINDPHLAIYWILHWSVSCNDDALSQILKSVEKTKNPLLKTFYTVFSGLKDTDTLTALPGFKRRRSDYLLYHWFDKKGGFDYLIRSYLMDEYHGIIKARGLLLQAVKDNKQKQLQDFSRKLDPKRPGAAHLKAMNETYSTEERSVYADEVFRQFLNCEEDPVIYFRSLWALYKLVGDITVFGQAVEKILSLDTPSSETLGMALYYYEKTGDPRAEKLREQFMVQKRINNHLEALLEKNTKAQLKSFDALVDTDKPLTALSIFKNRKKFENELLRKAACSLFDITGPEQSGHLETFMTSLGYGDKVYVTELVSRMKSDFEKYHPVIKVLLLTPELKGDDILKPHVKEELLKILAPYGHRPEVLTWVVENLGGKALDEYTEYALSKLFTGYSDNKLLKKMDKTQCEFLLTRVFSILNHGSGHVRGNLGRVIYYFSNPEGEEFLTKKFTSELPNEGEGLSELKANLYSALRNINTESSQNTLVEKLFTEDTSFWRLSNAFSEIFSKNIHTKIMAAIKGRKDEVLALRGANVYVSTLSEFVKNSDPYLNEISSWAVFLKTSPDDQGQLSYILTEGLAGAVRTNNMQLAQDIQNRLSELSINPWSFYWNVDRNIPYSTPFDKDPQLKKELTRLLSGKTGMVLKKVETKLAKARKSSKPVSLNDKELALLVGTSVEQRFYTDTINGFIWFIDGNGNFHFFDGYSIKPPPFGVNTQLHKNLRDFLKDEYHMSQRLIFWDNKGNRYWEIVSYEKRIIIRHGINNGGVFLQHLGIMTDNQSSTDSIMKGFLENPPKGFTADYPYYRKGEGTILRSYYSPLPDGGYNSDGRQYLGIIGGRFSHNLNDENDIRKYDTPDDAVFSFETWELEHFKTGTVTTNLEIDDGRKVNEDLSLYEYFQKLERDDSQSALYHGEAITKIVAYLESHGFSHTLKGMSYKPKTPSTQREIAAYENYAGHSVPTELKILWESIGGYIWNWDEKGYEFYTASEMLKLAKAKDPIWESANKKVSKNDRDYADSLFPHCHVLLKDLENKRHIIYNFNHIRSGENLFSPLNMEDPVGHLYFIDHLGWMISTRSNHSFIETLFSRSHFLRFVGFDEKFNKNIEIKYFIAREKGREKFWEITVNREELYYGIRYGRVGNEGSFSKKSFPTNKALSLAVTKLINDKESKGYTLYP